MKNSMKGS